MSRLTKSAARSGPGKIGLVFQNPDDQLFMPTVWEDVAFGPLNQGLDVEEVRRRVEAALEIAGMAGSAGRPPHHLSLGQKKRGEKCTVGVTPLWEMQTGPGSSVSYRRSKG